MYIFSFFDNASSGYAPRIHVLRTWNPSLSVCSSVSLRGDTLVVADSCDRAIVVSARSPKDRAVVLESSTIFNHPQTVRRSACCKIFSNDSCSRTPAYKFRSLRGTYWWLAQSLWMCLTAPCTSSELNPPSVPRNPILGSEIIKGQSYSILSTHSPSAGLMRYPSHRTLRNQNRSSCSLFNLTGTHSRGTSLL